MRKAGPDSGSPRQSRRQFMKKSLLGAGVPLLALLPKAHALPASFFAGAPVGTDPWAMLPQILDRIKAPSFPKREFVITKFGAVGDNKTDCTSAFQKAIAACHTAGGGSVVVPKGEFLTGAVRLRSNVNLRVDADATIRFSRDPDKYPLVLTSFEGVELMNYSSFIYALDEENIAVTGSGTIDGNADAEHWWSWVRHTRHSSNGTTKNDRDDLFAMGERGVPVEQRVFGPGHYLRPQFIQPYRCKNILIEGVTLLNSPMWQVTPALCTNVTVRGLTIRSSGPNTDGCDPESSSDFLIENCFFDTGDDCIAIKSGRNADGRRLQRPSENIVVRNCRMKNGHGGVTVGSEDSGGVRNVFAENCHMDSPHLYSALRIKNNAMRGGLIENFYARNIDVGQVGQAALAVNFYYEEGQQGSFTPVARNIQVSNMTVQTAPRALYLRGFPNAPIENVRLTDCVFSNVSNSDVVENVKGLLLRNVKENGKAV